MQQLYRPHFANAHGYRHIAKLGFPNAMTLSPQEKRNFESISKA